MSTPTINYELALKLKNAGFPQKSWNADFPELTKVFLQVGGKVEPYTPTLSELIEACGDGWFQLHREGGRWQAKCNNYDWAGLSNTPEEAVAYLWLALKNN